MFTRNHCGNARSLFYCKRARGLIANSQFIDQNSVECWCDFGANLVQHFMQRYSRYSRYRTKTHDKATISNDITRYSRYQTVLLKLEEIISTFGRNLQKMLRICGAFFIISERTEVQTMIALRQVMIGFAKLWCSQKLAVMSDCVAF